MAVNEKTFNTRVQLKYDSYTSWKAVESTFKPYKGEVCIVNPGTNLADDASSLPCLMKVGDGSNFFKDLPWVSAIAADVYDWAKKSEPDWNDFPALPIEVKDEGTGKFVTDIAYSDNTITISRADVVWGDIAGEIPDTKLPEIPLEKLPEIPADKIIQSKDYGKVTANTGSVEADAVHDTFAIKGEGVISTSATNDTITIKADLKDYALKSDIPTNHKIIQTPVSDPTASGSATAFIASISQNANGEITVSKKNITAADLGLSNAMHFVGISTTDPSKGTVTIENKVHTPANGDVVLYSGKEYVYGNNKWNELGDEGSHALKTITITGNDGLTGGGSLESNRTIGIADNGVTTVKIADKNVTKAKLSDDVQASLAKADSALQAHQDISGKKDKQTAVTNQITKSTHVLSSLTQNENGDITYEVKELTPADIGAPTVKEVSDQGVAILAEAQKYADSLNHEDTKYSAAPQGGLKLSENNEFSIDDSLVFIFNCGTSTEVV